MANKDEYLEAAKTPVADRSPEQAKLVSDAHRVGMQDVKNADFKTKQHKG
jgi:hypothetical protein